MPAAVLVRRSSLHLAARSGDAALVRVLLDGLLADEQAAFVNEADLQGVTPLFLAQLKGARGVQLGLTGRIGDIAATPPSMLVVWVSRVAARRRSDPTKSDWV